MYHPMYDPIIEHLREFWVAYVLVTGAVAPVLYLTRRYSIPLILYCVELTLYSLIMHTVVWGFIQVAVWFQDASSMERALGRSAAPDWDTPYFQFWRQELYTPEWVFWMEVVAIAVMIGLIWRYRPMRVQRKREREGRLDSRKGYAQDKFSMRKRAMASGAASGRRR